jgi:outer membrane receptor protein involved in Fe transport
MKNTQIHFIGLLSTIKLLAITFIISTFVFAGNTGKVSGKITNEAGAPVIGVNVMVEGTSFGSATDTDGFFVILFIPPGEYSIKATAMGYAKSIIEEVVIAADLTTSVNVLLKQSMVEGETVTVTAEKPLIETDLVSSRKIVTSEMIEEMPIDDIDDILNLTAGFVDGHARGGRDGEILYLINGVPAIDPIDNSFDTEVPTLAIAETDIITSGISVEYSNALSGVVNMITKEGGSSLSGKFKMKTDNNSILGLGFPGLRQGSVFEGAIGGPIPKIPVRWFIAGEFTNNEGRYGNSNREAASIAGSLTWRPFQKTKIQFSINHHYSSDNSYSHRYSRSSFENENTDGDEQLDRVVTIKAADIFDEATYSEDGLLYGLVMDDIIAVTGLDINNIPKRNMLVEIDIDGAGTMVAGDGDFREEDLNGNGVWELTDFNRNGTALDSSFIDMNDDGKFQWGIDIPIPNTDETTSDGHDIVFGNRNLTSDIFSAGFNNSFNMLDNLLRNNEESTHMSLSLNQQFAKNTFIQVFLSQFKTYYHYNTNETSDVPTYLDFLHESDIGDQFIEEYKEDLFTDWNNNDFLDISEDAFPDSSHKWLAWEDVPIQNSQDIDKFYTWGNGTTFSRNRWNEDEKIIWNFKTILTSQVTQNHLLKTGFEMNMYDVYDHDVDMPSGGNIYGQNIGSRNDWGRLDETFYDWGFDGIEGNGDEYEGNGVWDHLDYGEDGVLAIDGNGDGDFDDNFIDLPPDNGEGDGKVNYNELHEEFDDVYQDNTWSRAQKKLDPLWWGIFVEDKMEFESLVVVGGIRLDYFDPKFENYPSNINDPVIDQTTGGEVKDPTSVASKWFWSPRIGISYPVTDRDALYFNYGKTFQVPQFQYMYRNINWDFSGAFPIVGNPDIQPETTTSYELGLRHQIGTEWRLEVKGFYKDIQGLVDTKQIWIKANQYYTRHINGDYGNVKGFEIDLFKKFSNYFGGNINYTYSIAKGKSSSALQNYRFTWANQIIPRDENYLDWDQRHTINASVKTIIPLVGVGVNTTMSYGSGLPYSPPNKSLKAEINTLRMPGTLTVNLYADKNIKVPQLGDKAAISLFLWIDNLFDNENILGLADEEWFGLYSSYQEAYEDGNRDVFPSEDDNNGIDDDEDGYIDDSFEQEYMWIMDTDGDGEIDYNKKYPAGGIFGDPRYYSEGRQIKIGLAIKF